MHRGVWHAFRLWIGARKDLVVGLSRHVEVTFQQPADQPARAVSDHGETKSARDGAACGVED